MVCRRISLLINSIYLKYAFAKVIIPAIAENKMVIAVSHAGGEDMRANSNGPLWKYPNIRDSINTIPAAYKINAAAPHIIVIDIFPRWHVLWTGMQTRGSVISETDALTSILSISATFLLHIQQLGS